MKMTNILHITDLHFGSSPPCPVGDLRDGEITQSFSAEILNSDCRNRFIPDIKRLLDSMQIKIDMIACTGDLGWKADESSLNLGAGYLAKISGDLQVSSAHVVVSPGNHDLDQNAEIGKELDKFCRVCETKNFTYAKRNKPAILRIKKIAIICLNTCLGGTEHALHGLPDGFWKKERDDLKKREEEYGADGLIDKIESDLKYQVQAMDIPALGFDQIDSCIEALAEGEGDSAVVLMHHNPVPTSNVDIRPYASLIDSGSLVLRLMEKGRHVIILHGHTHSKSGLSMHTHQGDEGGFVASIGNRGLTGGPNSAGTLIQIMTTDRNEYIKADVYFIERNATIYENNFQYTLQQRSLEPIEVGLELDKLTKNRCLTFCEVSKLLEKPVDNSLAEGLVQQEPTRLRISGKGQSLKEWRITRIR